MSLTMAMRRAAAAVPARSFSTASTVNIDWAGVRAKMMTEETRAEADRAREVFQKRLSAAEGVGQALDIDWAGYKKALPEIDIDALRDDYETVVASTPAIAYDGAADAAAHQAKEASWTGFAGYCAQRIKELQALQAEQSKHKLHTWYRRRQLYSRFPGLYENLHNKVRGQWDVALWGQYIAYRAGSTSLPWDPSTGDVGDAQRRELMLGIASKAGVKPEELGFVVPPAPVAAAPAAPAAH